MYEINHIFFHQAYHSQITKYNESLGNFALLPLRTQVRGPAIVVTTEDIIDESLYYFKANVFFRTYEIKVRCSFSPNVMAKEI